MCPLKVAIFQEVKKHRSELADQSYDMLNSLIFRNPSGLRLSLSGFIICRTIFTVYSFQLSTDILSRHRIALSKLQYPYYLTTKRLILFSEMDAVMIKLHGSVSNFLESCHKIEH